MVRWSARSRDRTDLRAAPPPDRTTSGGDGRQQRAGPDALGGDGFDVDEAYEEHAGPIFAFAVNSLGDRGAAEDALQEVFVRAWRAGDRYGSERGSVRTWLFAIARNVVVDAHRAGARRPRPVDVAEERDRPAAGDAHGASLDRLVVVEALARLGPEHREVVVHVHLLGGTYEELSERTGVPRATLRTRMYYGLRALRAVIDEDGGGGGDHG